MVKLSLAMLFGVNSPQPTEMLWSNPRRKPPKKGRDLALVIDSQCDQKYWLSSSPTLLEGHQYYQYFHCSLCLHRHQHPELGRCSSSCTPRQNSSSSQAAVTLACLPSHSSQRIILSTCRRSRNRNQYRLCRRRKSNFQISLSVSHITTVHFEMSYEAWRKDGPAKEGINQPDTLKVSAGLSVPLQMVINAFSAPKVHHHHVLRFEDARVVVALRRQPCGWRNSQLVQPRTRVAGREVLHSKSVLSLAAGMILPVRGTDENLSTTMPPLS